MLQYLKYYDLIDSLKMRESLLEREIIFLKSHNATNSMEISTLKKTMSEYEISTKYYESNLTFYTVVFATILTVLLTAATLINWFALVRPLKEKIDASNTDLTDKLENFKSLHIDYITDELNETTSWALKNFIMAHEHTDPKVSFLFSVRLLRILVNWEGILPQNIHVWLTRSMEFLSESEFDKNFKELYYEEILRILFTVIDFTSEQDSLDDNKLATKLNLDFNKKMADIDDSNDQQLELKLQ